MTRLLPALLLLVSTVAVPAESVVDGFEAAALGPLWNTRFVSVGRVTSQRDIVHSGTAALGVEIREGDVAMVGGDGTATEGCWIIAEEYGLPGSK